MTVDLAVSLDRCHAENADHPNSVGDVVGAVVANQIRDRFWFWLLQDRSPEGLLAVLDLRPEQACNFVDDVLVVCDIARKGIGPCSFES
ncbi:hypothetical protein FQZ97_1103610 [compost metagenome]